MVEQEWARVQRELDSGHPSPLGLVKITSANVHDLGRNHQVLAYGYDLDGDDLTLWLYDPNYPDRDDICLALSLASPDGPTQVTYTPSSERVVCFFHNPYTPATALPS